MDYSQAPMDVPLLQKARTQRIEALWANRLGARLRAEVADATRSGERATRTVRDRDVQQRAFQL